LWHVCSPDDIDHIDLTSTTKSKKSKNIYRINLYYSSVNQFEYI